MSEILPSDGHVIYEVDLEAEAAIEGPFDTWLRDHIADLLQFPGFLSAEVLADAGSVPGRIRRTVQYRLRDQAALDDYLKNHAPRMRETGVRLFGDRFTAERRVLLHREVFIRGKVSTENCLNCGEVLTGQHCSHCGQRAKVRVLSLWGMTKDVVGDVLNWDSRLWRTLFPLAFRPGLLTQEYLRGRRASYTPPFRMYLLLSVAFFLLASVGNDVGSAFKFEIDKDGGASLGIKVDDGSSTATPPAAGTGPSAPAAPAKPPVARKLDAETERMIDSVVKRVDQKDRERVRQELRTKLATMPEADLAPVKQLMNDPCSSQNFKVQIGAFGKDFEPRLRQACRKIWADTPSFGRALFENTPKMMFIFLPLIAAVMYLLYIGSGRYYVEHLLFVVHYHAFFFLGGLVILIVERGGGLAPGTAFEKGATAAGGLLTAAFVIYAPIYLYLAMRRVYGQGWFVTLLKYSTLGVAYLFCMTITAVGLLFYTALTL
ncbi:MAG: DUF4286 family protein [Gammaproteobacteria bacterium]|nr:DUF4286 family protein [Gammaproteobacteria bacterium]